MRKQLKNIKPQDWFVSITNIGMFFIFSKVWNGQNFLLKLLVLVFIIILFVKLSETKLSIYVTQKNF
ncbi:MULTISPECIES: hypothetical protein [Enterococcus]|uniref:hypothetical protein n=1 Tax=Enterococcus TaxID=1350 RepID=UPI0005C67A3A|nr:MULTISPECIES: hypothetical protein [Enterococcus]KNB96913.1 hypothetical protein LK21_00020 [Enterococcus faecium]